MPKSNQDDLLEAYRIASKLRKQHKLKLAALLMEDVKEKPERKSATKKGVAGGGETG